MEEENMFETKYFARFYWYIYTDPVRYIFGG